MPFLLVGLHSAGSRGLDFGQTMHHLCEHVDAHHLIGTSAAAPPESTLVPSSLLVKRQRGTSKRGTGVIASGGAWTSRSGWLAL